MRQLSLVGLLVACLASAAMAQAQGQAPKPYPELSKFNVAIGTWRFDTEIKGSAVLPAGRISGTERFEWLPGGFFMQMTREAKGPKADVRTLIVYRYDPAARAYIAALFHNAGVFETATITIEGNIWTWVGTGNTGDGKPLHERCTMTYAPNGQSCKVKCDASTDGKIWAPLATGTYTKVK